MSLTPYGAATTESSATRTANSLPYPRPIVAMESSAASAAASDALQHPGLHPGSEPATMPITNGPPRKFIPADCSTVALPETDDLELDLNEMLTRDGLGSPNPPRPKPTARQRSTSRSPYLEKNVKIAQSLVKGRKINIRKINMRKINVVKGVPLNQGIMKPLMHQ